jgi:hypothetical protein
MTSRLKLVLTLDLDINGYSEDGFGEDPAAAMRTMMRRGIECIQDQNNLIVRDRVVYTPMGLPIARLIEETAQ